MGYWVGSKGLVSTRIGMLLVVSAAVLGACGPPPSERPREGAPVGTVRAADAAVSYPTPSPSAALGGVPPPVNTLGQQTPTGTQPSPPSPAPSPVPGYVITATDGAGANLRTGPSTAASVITTLPEGTRVEVLGDPVSVEGRSWRQIRAGGREGWVVSVVVRQP